MKCKKSESSESDSLHAAANNTHVAIQRKLSIGAVDDPLEYEADAMADKVMRMPEANLLQRNYSGYDDEEIMQQKPAESFIQKKCAHCDEEEKLH